MLRTIDRNTPVTREGVARRLAAIRNHMGMEKPAFAAWLGVNRTKYANWENTESGNFPASEDMARLCDMIPSMTLDYIYRGRFGSLQTDLALKLAAWENDDDPTTPGFDLTKYSAYVFARR